MRRRHHPYRRPEDVIAYDEHGRIQQRVSALSFPSARTAGPIQDEDEDMDELAGMEPRVVLGSSRAAVRAAKRNVPLDDVSWGRSDTQTTTLVAPGAILQQSQQLVWFESWPPMAISLVGVFTPSSAAFNQPGQNPNFFSVEMVISFGAGSASETFVQSTAGTALSLTQQTMVAPPFVLPVKQCSVTMRLRVTTGGGGALAGVYVSRFSAFAAPIQKAGGGAGGGPLP